MQRELESGVKWNSSGRSVSASIKEELFMEATKYSILCKLLALGNICKWYMQFLTIDPNCQGSSAAQETKGEHAQSSAS